MIATATKIDGVFTVAIEPIADARGFFARTFCVDMLRAQGVITGPLRQTSISANPHRGTLRGLHWQAAPAAENKLVRPIAGRIFDVAVDVRPPSPTFRRWLGVELDASRQDGLFVPAGCAHGFLTLTNDCIVEYGMDADFAPEMARGARWNDPAFAIAWPLAPLLIGERDRSWPDFAP